jgi:hypothetical protein
MKTGRNEMMTGNFRALGRETSTPIFCRLVPGYVKLLGTLGFFENIFENFQKVTEFPLV